ncbi:MAG: transcriptional regulator [Flavobacteriales bacterium]|jgi:DNA-binding HxlR family transcriptional regulator|nr:transcriptional regulator [Flavobacteriales bacterium]|tara:strand:- start:564 stop:875 length:312 start_codon:yes stop_codon:yes gene_type:complete
MKGIEELCPTSIFAEKLGGKWKLAIIYNLRNRNLRFGQLANLVDGVSRKVLTEHLRQMEEDKLIVRTVYKEIPPRVEYGLTQAGKDLMPLFQKIDDWVRKHYA